MQRAVAAALTLVLTAIGACAAQAVVVRRPSLVEEYVQAETVFSGVAINLEHVPCVGVSNDDCVEDRWEFAVGQVWKGPTTDRIYIYDSHLEGTPQFQIGHHYVVYARRREQANGLFVHPGSLTKEACSALVERYSLGRATVVCDTLRLPEVRAEEAAACLLGAELKFKAPPDPASCDTIVLFVDDDE